MVVFVVFFELRLWGGAYQASPVIGAIPFTIRYSAVDNCDPNVDTTCENAFQPLTELVHCQQSNNQSSYKGDTLPCVIYDTSSAQIISDQSVAIIMSAVASSEQLACKQLNYRCSLSRICNQSRTQELFYTAEMEAFTISFDHTVSSADECTTRIDYYACSSESSSYQERLQSVDEALCQREHAKGRVFADPRRDIQTDSAPCYLVPNTTQAGEDVFTLQTAMEASGLEQDDCNSIEENVTDDEGTCCTYREIGATILMNILRNDFQRYQGKVDEHRRTRCCYNTVSTKTYVCKGLRLPSSSNNSSPAET